MNIHPQDVLLICGFAALPVVLVWLMGWGRVANAGDEAWSPGGKAAVAVPGEFREPQLQPLVMGLRVPSVDELAGYAVGLRHLPIEVAAPLLRQLQRSADPAVQLYAQTILQEGREKLQVQMGRLGAANGSDRGRASFLEAGLRLLHPALLPVADAEAWTAGLVTQGSIV